MFQDRLSGYLETPPDLSVRWGESEGSSQRSNSGQYSLLCRRGAG